MNTTSYIDNILATSGREAYRDMCAKLRGAVDTLDSIHAADVAADQTPKHTAQKFAYEVGHTVAAVVLASLVNSCAWDGRISSATKRWAQSVEDAFDEAAANRLMLSTSIHRAHLDQIALAFADLDPDNNIDPDEPTEPEQDTDPTEAALDDAAEDEAVTLSEYCEMLTAAENGSTTEPDPAEVDDAVADAVAQEIEPFPHLAALIRTASEERAAALRCFIENGYFPSWSNRDREDIDTERGLREYSTATRWEQYQSGKIDRAKAVELATRRAVREVAKQQEAYFAKLNAAADTDTLRSMTISLTWHRSSVWGYNPTAEATGDYRRTIGKASGCGYDKGSAAAADALNAQPQALRVLYDRAEAALAEGADPHSKTACTGYSWGGVLGYGSGYSVLPYFEGGVGMSSLLDLFTRGGYSVRSAASGRLYDCYLIDRADSVRG